MNILLAPDSFKHALSSTEIVSILNNQIKFLSQGINQVIEAPLSDGGEGFLDILKSILPISQVDITSVNAIGEPISAYYLFDSSTLTAYIELAVASGIDKIKNHQQNPFLCSTYGTGLLIKDALLHGAKSIYLSLGGSASNDGGVGILEALGVKFFDKNHNELKRLNALQISQIESYTLPANFEKWKKVNFKLLTDVKNPLLGTDGASYQFGPQKGASVKDVVVLDNTLSYWTSSILKLSEKEVNKAGMGAAGGVAAAIKAFFKTDIDSGFDYLSTLIQLDAKIEEADLIITGEGAFDETSLSGKVVGSILQKATDLNKTVIVFCGVFKKSEKMETALKEYSKLSVVVLKKEGESTEEAISNMKNRLEESVKNLFKLQKKGSYKSI